VLLSQAHLSHGESYVNLTEDLLHNLSQIRRQSEQMPPAYANVFLMSRGETQTDNRSHKRHLLP